MPSSRYGPQGLKWLADTIFPVLLHMSVIVDCLQIPLNFVDDYIFRFN